MKVSYIKEKLSELSQLKKEEIFLYSKEVQLTDQKSLKDY